uniref:G-protein coupled receptors family 1 profile domain-containing protein n=1 Tax=Panagrolaimus superbus TaxID=310955 RepID=A0A914ZC04_9BILA
MLRAGFALVCQKTDDIGKYQLSAFADLFRIIYERTNVNRPRFSRNCQTLAEFYQHGNRYDTHLGEALANDTVFMNMLSGNIKRTVISFSLLPHLVLKTRLLLQHFPLAAIKLKQMIENGRKCRENDFHINLESAESSNSSNFSDHNITTDEDCRLKNIDDINTETADDFVKIGEHAALGVFIEILLLGAVIFNTVFLSILLHQTKDKLSTATILFIFNILFSNALFVASFVCMFSDFYIEEAYGAVTEDQFYQNSAALIIAETLQIHLFAQSEFLKHLIQETLFSLAQNGSLLGLTHLLVLVLVVINKSMSGKAIRLSRRCVILVFAFVWVFLIFTHLIFSALQFSAIQNLDNMFNILQSNPGSLNCSRSIKSDYVEVGKHCDRVAIFHTFGVYLLRGHTLFTLTFLVAAILVFMITLLYHWRVRSQHDFLGDNMRDHTPHRRRETLFNTLLISISAYFVSIVGQTFIEIAVFWVDDRNDKSILDKALNNQSTFF